MKNGVVFVIGAAIAVGVAAIIAVSQSTKGNGDGNGGGGNQDIQITVAGVTYTLHKAQNNYTVVIGGSTFMANIYGNELWVGIHDRTGVQNNTFISVTSLSQYLYPVGDWEAAPILPGW